METKPSYYAVIPASVRYAKIPDGAKLLYGELTALSSKEGYCWASNQYFAELYGVHKGTISVWVAALTDGGFISSEITDKTTRKIFINPTEKPVGGYRKIVRPPTEKPVHSIKESTTSKVFPVGKSISSSKGELEDTTAVDVDGDGNPVPPKPGKVAAQAARNEGMRVLQQVNDAIVKDTGIQPILGPAALKAVNRALQYISAKDIVLMVEDALADGSAEKLGMNLNMLLSDARINKFRLENQ